jgi:PLP dependent protein
MPFQDLPERVAEVSGRIERARQRGGHAQSVRIVGVTKTYGAEAVGAAVGAGIGDVGENRIQEAIAKMAEVAVPVRWHLIGHLQRNKVKQLDGFHLVHSMDSSRLADALHVYGEGRGRPVEVLLQVNVSGEGSKGGYEPEGMEAEAARLRALTGLVVRGVMTMAPLDADEAVLRRVFGGAREVAGRSGRCAQCGGPPRRRAVDGHVG